MGKLIHPKEKEIKGPWLLDQEDFEALDGIIEEIDELLLQAWYENARNEVLSDNNNILEEDLDKKINDRKELLYIQKKKCEIISQDETKLSDETILGLLKDQQLKRLKPKYFKVEIQHGYLFENNFKLNISNTYDGSLKYEIRCYNPNIESDIQYKVDNWIEGRKPNKVLHWWANYNYLLLFPLFLAILGFGIKSFVKTYSTFSTYQEKVRVEMYELAQSGINESNRDLAFELLLKLESNYQPKTFQPILEPNNPIWIKLFVCTILVFIAVLFKPKTTIGLGEMKSRLKLSKFWIKFVLITLPAIIIIGPIWNSVLAWLYQ